MYHIYADDKILYYPSNEAKIITSPKLTLEMGKAGSFTFHLPPTHSMYGSLRKLMTTIVVESDAKELFRGRILSEGRKFDNTKLIYCEGNLAYLVDSVQKSEAFEGTTHALFRKIISNHNARVDPEKRFIVGEITVEDRSIIISGQSDIITDADTDAFNYKQIAINSTTNEWVTTYDYISSCLIDYCGGYLRTRREADGIYIDYLSNYGNSATQEIEFGVNLLDLTEEVSVEDLFTVLIPLGDDNLTIASVNGGSDELVDEAAVALYGRIVRTHVFDNVNQASTLLENGIRYLNTNVNVPITITIKAVDLHFLNPTINEIYVGDRVYVKSVPHNIIDHLTCTKIEYDLENPANTVYTFGNPKQTLTQRYRKDKRKEESDTGGSAGSGAGGAGSKADEEAKKNLDKFFDAWINVYKESAHIDLGAVYKELVDAKEVLRQNVGIDLNAPQGTVDIFSMREDLRDLDGRVINNSTEIQLVSNDKQSQINALVGWSEKFEGETQAWHAQLQLQADENGKAIAELNADYIDRIAAIELEATELAASALMKAEYDANRSADLQLISDVSESVSTLSSRYDANRVADLKLISDVNTTIATLTANYDGKIASIEAKATNQGTLIQANADAIKTKASTYSLNAAVTTINDRIKIVEDDISGIDELIANRIAAADIDVSKLESKIINVASVIANTIRTNRTLAAEHIIMSGATVATQNWVNDKLSDAGYLTALPDYIKVPTLSATSNMYLGGWTVATQKWVKEYLSTLTVPWDNITGKPSYFPAKSHRHSFSFTKSIANGHSHKIRVNGTTYTSMGVSTNATHSLSVSGNTGYTGG